MSIDPTPSIEEVFPIMAAYVAMEGHSTGGNLHIVLDDGNLEQHHIHWCNGYACAVGDKEGRLLAYLLAEMDVIDLVDLHRARPACYDVPDGSGDAEKFWRAVEETRFAGWGGHHETAITGYKRDADT